MGNWGGGGGRPTPPPPPPPLRAWCVCVCVGVRVCVSVWEERLLTSCGVGVGVGVGCMCGGGVARVCHGGLGDGGGGANCYHMGNLLERENVTAVATAAPLAASDNSHLPLVAPSVGIVE